MTAVFGKSYAYTLYAMVDDQFIALPSAPDSIYLFKDKPSLTDARAGTGALATISTWSATADGTGKTFTVSAIDDPDPTAGTQRQTYWIAANFKYEAGEQAQTIIRALPIQRAQGWHKAITTTASDLEAIFPDIDSYTSAATQQSAITNAKSKIELFFEAQGFEWALIWEVERLNLACAYKAVSDCLFGLKAQEWVDMAGKFAGQSEDLLQIVKLQYDALNEGQPTTTESHSGFMRIIA